MSAAPATGTASGWQARLELGFAPRGPRTALVHRQQRGPLAVQRPFYPEGDACHVYVLHPPGGVVGGDTLHIQVDLAAGAHALLTTPGATKFYASAGETARQVQSLHVADGATLEWLPQENIFFPGALASLQTRVELEGGARFIGWETQCLGRPVVDERFEQGLGDFRLHIQRNGDPLLLDRLTVIADRLQGAATLRGQPVTATLLATPAADGALAAVRALLQDVSEVGCTLMDGLLVVRYLGASTEQARTLFTAVWSALRPSVLGRAPCPPRIWFT